MCWRSKKSPHPLTPSPIRMGEGEPNKWAGRSWSRVTPLLPFSWQKGLGDEGCSPTLRSLALALLLVVVQLLAFAGPAEAQRPDGAGLVIQHGDGTLVYAYVQFEEEEINGIELLTRSGIAATIAPFGGLGGGVCSINGEGCPADNCFCESFTNPAFYWHYYVLDAGAWVELPLGASSRTLRDGDVDGWSWNAGEHSLPATSIDEIAALNGIDRNPPEPTATATPLPTDTPAPTATSSPPPTATILPPTPTAGATQTSAPSATPASTPSPATASGTAAMTAISTSTRPSTATPTATPRGSPTPSATTQAEIATVAEATSTSRPTSVAVIVTPGATPQALPPAEDNGGSRRDYLMFGALLVGVLVAGGVVLLRNRRGVGG